MSSIDLYERVIERLPASVVEEIIKVSGTPGITYQLDLDPNSGSTKITFKSSASPAIHISTVTLSYTEWALLLGLGMLALRAWKAPTHPPSGPESN